MFGSFGLSGQLRPKLLGRRPERVGLWWKLRNFRNVWRGLWRVWLARLLGLATMHGELRARLFRADGRIVDYGLVSTRVVTTAFVNFMVDQLQVDTTEWGDFKFHDSGVGITAEAIGDIDIETTDAEARATGSQTESAANAYRSVGTIAYTTTKAITEHGLFSKSTGTTLLDRSVFSAINVVNGDSIEFTYTLTCTAGS